MKHLIRRLPFLAFCAFALSLPGLVLAQAVTGETPEVGGVPVAAIVSILTSVAGLITGVKQWLPSGWHTPLNAVVLFLTSAINQLTELSPTGEAVSWAAMVGALIATILSRFKTKGGWQV